MSSSPTPAPDAGAAAMAVDDLEANQLESMSTKDIVRVINLLDEEIHVLKEQLRRDNVELENVKDKIKEVQEKTTKLNKQLP